MIEGVVITPLRKIPDERGMVMHMLRVDAPHFEKFGEIYFSVSYPGVIKGWNLHTKQVQNYAVIAGMIKLVFYDPRAGSSTYGEIHELFIGEDNYCLVRIPTGIYSGYKAYGMKPTIVANCATEPHDPHESEQLDPFDIGIPYQWELKHR